MVDFKSYYCYTTPGKAFLGEGEFMPIKQLVECDCPDCEKHLSRIRRVAYDHSNNADGQWEAEQYILCPPRVIGYVLREKSRAQLLVTKLGDGPSRDKDKAWQTKLKLASDEKTKNMILDLVVGHRRIDPDDRKDSRDGDELVIDDIVE